MARIADLMLEIGRARASGIAGAGQAYGQSVASLGGILRDYRQGKLQDQEFAAQQQTRQLQADNIRAEMASRTAAEGRDATTFANQQTDRVTATQQVAHQKYLDQVGAVLVAPKDAKQAAWSQLLAGGDPAERAGIPEQYPGDEVVGTYLAGQGYDLNKLRERTQPKAADGFTLKPGETRFNATGGQVASIAGEPGEQEWVVRGGKVTPITKGTRQAGDRPYVPPSQAQPDFEWIVRNGQPLQVRKGTSQPGDTPFTANQGQPTTGQFSAGGYAGRIEQAEGILSKVEGDIAGMNPASYFAQNNSPYAGFTSDQFQSFDQASRNFINAVLRRESGAAISPSEFESARKQYLPQPGDAKETLAQKKANRDYVFSNLKREAGAAYSAPPALADGTNAPIAPGSTVTYNGKQYRVTGIDAKGMAELEPLP